MSTSLLTVSPHQVTLDIHNPDTNVGGAIDSPRIFETLGIVGTTTKLFATGFYGIAKTLGMIIFSVWLVEKVGRRNGLIWGAFIGSLPMWYIGGYVMKADPAGNAAAGNVDQNGWGYLAMGEFSVNQSKVMAANNVSVCISVWPDLLRYMARHHMGLLLRDFPNW